jgi:SNF2 family DNA or RNA helicase
MLARLRENKKKVLIFSQLTSVLDLLEGFHLFIVLIPSAVLYLLFFLKNIVYLKHKKYPYERLDGSMNRINRQLSIDRFQNPEIDSFVFLLSTR